MLNQNQSKNTPEYQDIKLAWRINPSFSHDLFHFLWSIAEKTYCSRHYPNEKSEWRARLAPDIVTQIDEVTDWQTSHLFQSSLGTMFHFSDFVSLAFVSGANKELRAKLVADSIDGVLACLTEPEPMKIGMLKAGAHPGWTDSIFQHLEYSKGKLQAIIYALKEAGYEEYWHQEIEPIVVQKCEELQRELSQYDIRDILDSINGLLGPGYNVTHGGIHLTYFSAGVAYHLPDNSSVQSFPINIRQLVSTSIHEWLHNFTQSPELREWYDGLYASPFFAHSRELLGSWGSGNDEDFVVAAETYIAVKLGITSSEEAFNRLYTNWDASLVLGVIVYHQMNEKTLKGKTYETFLLDLFKSGRIQAENLEQQYIATLEAHIGHEQSQIAYGRYKMKKSIREYRRKGRLAEGSQVMEAWIDALKKLGYHLSSEVATETQIGAKMFPIATFDDVIHVELEKAGQPKVGIDIIEFQDEASAQTSWNDTLGQENATSLNNFCCVFPSFLDRQQVAKGCWIQERHLINIFVIVPYAELSSATDVIREIVEAYPCSLRN